jgi:nicotinate-nucleotide adenylyltransferase
MKIGIMGGTFDPIHLGHLIAGECAREGAALDEVWFMPLSVPPHKERPEGGADGKARWEMVCLAVDGYDRFRPIDLELTRGGTSYSIDTLTELQKRRPGDEFHYIIGGDMVQYLPHWHRIDELLLLTRFIGLERPGTDIDWTQLTPAMREAVTMIPMRQLDISSTDIRLRRKQGRSVRYLVPEAVRTYMEEGKLYDNR